MKINKNKHFFQIDNKEMYFIENKIKFSTSIQYKTNIRNSVGGKGKNIIVTGELKNHFLLEKFKPSG